MTISLPFGSLIIGPLIDRFGRKPISIVTTIPFLISWILIATSKNVETIYVARILAGMAAGINNIDILLYARLYERTTTTTLKMKISENCRFNDSGFNLCQRNFSSKNPSRFTLFQ